MTDSSSEPTYSWAKRVNDNKGLFESAGAIAKQALESSQQVSAAGSAAEKGLTEKIHGGFAKARIAITAVDALCKPSSDTVPSMSGSRSRSSVIGMICVPPPTNGGRWPNR